MPRKSKTDELREKFEAAIEKGLVSESAAERTQALRSAGDLLNPNLTDLQKQLKQAEDARTTAENALKTVTTERDQAQGVLCIAIQSALQGSAAKGELSDLRTNFDSKIVEARKELTEEATQKLWASQRAENNAKDALKTAQAQFGARGQQILLDEMKRIIEENHIPEPTDLNKLPAGISPLYLTLWNHTPIKAQLLLSFAKAFPEPSENFTRTLVRCLKAQLPVYEGMMPPDPIEHLQDKIDALRSLGQKWPGVLEEVNRQIEEAQVQRQADFLRNHYAELAAAQHASSLRGEGRTEINVQPQESVTGYQGECIDPEHCCCPKHNGLPAHLRADTWLGNRPSEAKVEDINARHEVDTTRPVF